MKVYKKLILDIETGQRLFEDSYFYEGAVDLCCGPTSQETAEANAGEAFNSTLQSAFGQRLAGQTATLGNLNTTLGKIGSGQQGPGFSGAENASNISQIQNTGAAAAKNADQATLDAEAGQGGGGASGEKNGVQAEIAAQTKTGAENLEANNLLKNTSENFQVGRQNTASMAGGLASLAGLQDPSSIGSVAQKQGESSFGMASTIEQQQAQKDSEIAGGITSAALDAATFGAGAAGGGGLSGGLQALAG